MLYIWRRVATRLITDLFSPRMLPYPLSSSSTVFYSRFQQLHFLVYPCYISYFIVPSAISELMYLRQVAIELDFQCRVNFEVLFLCKVSLSAISISSCSTEIRLCNSWHSQFSIYQDYSGKFNALQIWWTNYTNRACSSHTPCLHFPLFFIEPSFIKTWPCWCHQRWDLVAYFPCINCFIFISITGQMVTIKLFNVLILKMSSRIRFWNLICVDKWCSPSDFCSSQAGMKNRNCHFVELPTI